MPATHGFFDSTRGRILARLLREPRTVAQLGEEMEISSNAARQHVTALERDGYVERYRQQPTRGKPAGMYRVTAEGQALFPKAYGAVLEAFADELHEEYGDHEAELFVQKLGFRLADRVPKPEDATPEERIDQAVGLLTELGAILDVRRFSTGSVRLEGKGCPLSGLVGRHPEFCGMIGTMIEDLTFLPVKVLCDNDAETPSCRFLVDAAGS